MDDTDADYSKQLRELFRSLLAANRIEEGLLGDWNALRRDRRARGGYRRAAVC